MTNYNLNNINDKDFEILCRDLLQKELGIVLESFKKGKDGGIDLRYTKYNHENTLLVVQAKHWYQSTFDRLFYELVNIELPKVKKINPTRYILVTSLGLLPQQKDRIKKEFEPYILDTGDIWGNDDVNNRLNIHEDVALSHYKLWLTSSRVLMNVLNNAIKSRSNFIVEEIEKNVRLFVPTQNYKQAILKLKNEHFLILTGEPGIGKTTLANHIIIGLLAEDFELIYINENIREAEDVFEVDKKQIFYFDDFLGANYLELINPQNNDSAIVNFISRISKSDNKLMILTSRTSVLNRAMQLSGKFQISKLDINKYEITIKEYNKLDKAKILYNHLLFSGLDAKYRDRIITDKNYLKIITHQNFNPRIIEFITEPQNIKKIEQEKYLGFVLNNLNNPQLIWRHPYESQLDDYARFLITSLFSIGNIEETKLKEIFYSRLQYEIERNGFKRISNIYNIKLKELIGSFITRIYDGYKFTLSFFNPSITDFLIKYLNESKEEIWRIVESAIFVEQFIYRFSFTDSNLVLIEKNEYERFLSTLRSIENKLSSTGRQNISLLLIKLYCSIPLKSVEVDIMRLAKALNIDNLKYYEFDILIETLISIAQFEKVKMFVLGNWNKIIFKLFQIANNEDSFTEILTIFKVYGVDYYDFSEDEENNEKIQDYIDSYWFHSMDNVITELKDENADDVNDIEWEVEKRIRSLSDFNSTFNVEDSDSFEDLINWDFEGWFEEIMNERRAMQEAEEQYYFEGPPIIQYAELEINRNEDKNNISGKNDDEAINVIPFVSEDDQIDELFSK